LIKYGDIAARLEQFMIYKGWTKTTLASACGVLPQNINRYLSGKSDPSKLIIRLIGEGLNPDWAHTGQGEMVTDLKKPDNGRLTPVQQQVNEEKGKYIEDGLKLAFHAIGRRMTPGHIVEGDFLIFDKTATPDPGDYVLVKIDDDGPGIVKWRPGDPPPIGVLVKLVREREVLRK